LFSIGSVSTIDSLKCSLSRRQSHATVSEQESNTDIANNDVRSRNTYTHQTTPTKALPKARSMSQTTKHGRRDSFEAIAKRKQSVLAVIVEDINEGYDYYGTQAH
jgi:hypothetical protein